MGKGAQDFRQWKSCTRKKRYDTAKAASEMAAQLKQRAYLCNFCAHWHLTASEQKLISAIRRRR